MNRSEKWEQNKQTFNFSDQKRMRALLLTWEYPPHIVGGLARHTEGLALYLQKNGVEVHVITAKPHNMESIYEEVEGVKIHRVEPLNMMDHQFLNWIGGLNLAMTQKALELAKEHKYNIIHAHDWLVGEAAKTIAQNLKIPLITTIHGTEYGRNSGIYTELQQFIHNKENDLVHYSNALIVCSEFMKEEVIDLFTIPYEKINVIPNGVKMDQSEDLSSSYMHPILLNEKRKIIFSIGRLVKEKGFDLIIEAAAKIRRDDICFVIAGTGPMYHEYERLIKKHKLEKDVFLIGFISDQHRNQYFENSTLAIFPSRYEPFGIVALEAMKFSCPVIVSEIGGLRGIIKHSVTGLFMEKGNVESLVDQIEIMLNQPNHAEKMATNGKHLVDQLYSWQRVAEMTKRVYEELDLLLTIKEEQIGFNIK
jgi:glycosyltransferase involved in cell wall biosynthesis